MYESSSYHAQTPLDKHTKSVMQPTRKCGFASASSCSLHASAGLQPRCHAAHTQVRVCIHVALQLVHCNHTILQPTRKCRFAILLSCCPHTSAGTFASVLPCIPHASAGLQACRHAVHKQVRACTHVVLQPTRMCRCATSCHAAHTQVRVCTCVAPCSSHVGAGGGNQTVLQPTCSAGLRRCCHV